MNAPFGHVMDPITKLVRPAADNSERLKHASDFDCRRVMQWATPMGGGAFVSTVFLTVEHYAGMWFETLCFDFPEDHPMNGEEVRYATHEEAVKGHHEMCERVKAADWDPTPDAILCSVCGSNMFLDNYGAQCSHGMCDHSVTVK